jgi:hypothetical protein
MIPVITNDVIELLAPKSMVMQAWNNMVYGIERSLGETRTARNARQFWFGKGMEFSPVLLGRLTQLLNFVNSTKPMIIAYEKDKILPKAIAYTYGRRLADPLRVPAIYLTKKFLDSEPNARVKPYMSNRTVEGVRVVALAHELSHLVLGTNKKAPEFMAEKYAHDALHLWKKDPLYALNNAENYGFCIEMCTQRNT